MPEPAIASWCVKPCRSYEHWQVYHSDEPTLPRVVCDTRYEANVVATLLNAARASVAFLPSEPIWL